MGNATKWHYFKVTRFYRHFLFKQEKWITRSFLLAEYDKIGTDQRALSAQPTSSICEQCTKPQDIYTCSPCTNPCKCIYSKKTLDRESSPQLHHFEIILLNLGKRVTFMLYKYSKKKLSNKGGKKRILNWFFTRHANFLFTNDDVSLDKSQKENRRKEMLKIHTAQFHFTKFVFLYKICLIHSKTLDVWKNGTIGSALGF